MTTPAPTPANAELVEHASEHVVPTSEHHQALESRCSRINTYTTPSITTVIVTGELDLAVHDEFDHILTHAASTSTHLVLDLFNVTFCSSTTFNLFIRHTNALTRSATQRKLVIVTTSDIVLRPIHLLKIDELLTTASSLDQAYNLVSVIN